MQIRITTPGGFWAALDPTVSDGCLEVRLAEGFTIEARSISKNGVAVVDLGEDYGFTAIHAGSWEMVQKPEHYTTLMIAGGVNHVECNCGWSQPENWAHPEPILALRKSGMTHVRYMEAVQ